MDVVKDLWKNKPLFITVLVAIAGIIYLLYKSNSASIAASTATTATTATSTGAGSVAPGTFVEESYYNNSPTTVTSTPVSTPIIAVVNSIIKPAPAKTSTAGKGDTNFWIYTVPAGATLTSIAEFAKWGTDWSKLANYRNNLQILKAAGVNTSNPFAAVPAGLQISV